MFPVASAFAFALWLAFSPACRSLEPVNPNLSPSAQRVLDYLESQYGRKMLSGYNVYVHTPDDYGQTGKHAAIWGRDIQWLGEPDEIIEHAKKTGMILTLHWHWFFNDDSAWTAKRNTPVDVGAMVTPGTVEHEQVRKELAAAADTLQVFEDAGIPVLWRPLHEIDGGWFWWTDKEQPENTAQLWRMMFDYFTRERGLNNLIWVYSAGVGKKSVEYRQRFYPGPEYVDISGIDIYGVDYRRDTEPYWDYYRTMEQVSPGKMLACGECDAIPDPDKFESGDLPRWLYALPWWGAPSPNRSVEWARLTMRHDAVLTLDEIPALWGENLFPEVSLMAPLDDGSAWFVDEAPLLLADAVDRDGRIRQVSYFADGQKIGVVPDPPYQFRWADIAPGLYRITAVAEDDDGNQTESNSVRMAFGMEDAARGSQVKASSGEQPEAAVDGDYYTPWVSDKNDEEWIALDLGEIRRIDRVRLIWGWKIHPEEFVLELSDQPLSSAEEWTAVYSEKGRPYQAWKAMDRIQFSPVEARSVRLSLKKRAGNQNWGGYQLMAFEVPLPLSEK
jgi:mannan endo-1,4-beta-mannosidase